MALRSVICVFALAAGLPALGAQAVLTRSWVSPQGGTRVDQVSAMAVDTSGNVYLAGLTESGDMFTTPLRPYGGGVDAFVLKMNASGALLWGTYLGGSGHDQANAIALDASGGVVIAGFTESADFNPAITFRGGVSDAFVVRLNASNGSLMFGTSIGGLGADRARGLAVHSTGDIWIVGETSSSNITATGYQRTLRGTSDAFAARISTAGTMTAFTFLGGSGAEVARAVALDSAGAVYLTGSTESSDFPTLVPFQASVGGIPDAFVTKLSADGGALQYSSYLGGPRRESELYETGTAIAVDASGAAYVAGYTDSFSFPTVNPIQATSGGGTSDAFLVRVAPGGTSKTFSTYVGGSGSEDEVTLALLADGTVYLGGTTSSPGDPFTGQFQSPYDGFLARFTPALNRTLISTYVGSSATDTVSAITARGTDVWVAGSTSTPDGLLDGFAAKYVEEPLSLQIAPWPSILSYTVAGTGCAPASYTGTRVLSWTLGAMCTVTFASPQTFGSTRWKFASWLDGNASNPRVIEALPDTTVYATTSTAEHLVSRTVTPAGAGSVSITPASPSGDGWYSQNTAITVSATASAGYAFDKWSGASTSTASTASGIVTGPLSYTANFVCLYTLTASSATFGDTAASASFGVSAGAGCSWTAIANAGWITIAGGSGSGSGTVSYQVAANPGGDTRTGTITVGGKTFTVTQSGISNVAVTIATAPAGRAWTVSGANCSAGTYTGTATLNWRRGETCTVSVASPQISADTRWVFTGWDDGATAASRSLSTTGTASWTLNFHTEYRVQLAVTPAGAGSVSASPASPDGWYAAGTALSLSAAPAAGYLFSRWNPAATYTVSAPATLTAEFTQGPMCTYTPTNASLSVPAAGGSLNVSFTASGSSCAWNLNSDMGWAQPFPLAGVGNGQAGVTIYPNFSTRQRIAILRVGNASITITQPPPGGAYEERLAGLMYFNFLGRTATPAELAFHAGTLRSGLPVGQFVENLFGSGEFGFGGRFIAGLYVGILNRDAEFGGWLFQRNAYATKAVNQNQLVGNFLAAPEYRLAFGEPNDATFIQLLYRYVLLREASQSEVEFQSGILRSGASRVQMASDFLNSGEFRNGTGPRLTAFLLYACVLLRDGSSAERQTLAAQIAAGRTVRSVIDEMVASQEFQAILN